MTKFALLCSVLLLTAVSVLGQGGGNAAMSGTVTDPSGAVIGNAQVTMIQAGTQIRRTATTNASGQFTVLSLPPATYHLSVEAPGFKTYAQDVTLFADQTGSLQITMQLGQAQETVTVEATATMVNTTTPVIGQVIETQRVIELPLNGRNAADLTKLVAGTADSSNAGAGTQQGDTKQVPGTEALSVNGARPDQVSYNLDGGTNEDLMSNTNSPFPFPDAVQEFSVQTNSFDSQYGTNAGAVVNVVTKSGTNSFHGDAFEFVRNQVFNARNFFGTVRDPLKRNQYGGVIGGPIKKDSMFFFFGYQGTRIRTQAVANNNTILPTAANLTGDFSNYLSANPSVNPLGKVIQINDPTTGQPYPGNIIPTSQLSPVALAMAKYFPISQALPNGRFSYLQPTVENQDEFVGRIDKTLRNSQDRLYGRYYSNRYVHQPGYDGQDLLTDVPGSTVQSQNGALGYTWVPKANFLNNFVFTVMRDASDRGQGGQVPQFNTFGSNVFQLPQAEGGIRGFSLSQGYFATTSPTTGIGSFTDGAFIRNIGEIRDEANWTHGAHSFSFGTNIERDYSIIRNTDLENAQWTFTENYSNLALASWIVGHMHAFSQTSGDYSDSVQNVLGFFGQDVWKARQNLTITMGLRYEPQGVMREKYGRIEQFDPAAYYAGVRSTVVPTAPPGEFFVGDSYKGWTVPSTGEHGDYNNFAPRLGIAWDVSGNGKTVVRTGGGVFYSSRLPGLFLNDASISQPFSLRTDLTEPGNAANNLIPFANPLQSQPGFAAAFPIRYTLSTIPAGVPFTLPVTLYGMTPGVQWKTPTTYDWNFTIEHQLRSDMIVDASYVGLRATNLRQDIDLNPRAAGVGTDASRQYQGYLDIYEDSNSGMSNYNALQINLRKRPGGSTPVLKDLTLLANYTFSKAMEIGLADNGGITDLGSSKGSGMPFGNPNQTAFETGPAPFDHTQVFIASYVWNLPLLTGANRFVRGVAGGWQWSGILSHYTGDPLTILAGVDRSLTNLGNDRANFTGSADQYGQTAPSSQRSGCGSATCMPWLNTSLFVLPAIGTFGNVGKGAFRGPGWTNMDTALMKNFYPFSTRESMHLQLRGDFFNVFNHSEFNDPNVSRNSGNFGGIYGARDPRIIQFAMKFYF
jgi:Carboxypeptidase regulatory-like domain